MDIGACPPDTVQHYVLRAWQRLLAAGCDAHLALTHLLSSAEAAECGLLTHWLSGVVNRAEEPMIEFLWQDMV